MAEAKKLVPKRRFKEFQNAEAWEQCKLSKVVISHNAGVYISKDKYGVGTNIMGVGDIYGKDVVDGKVYRLAPVNDDKFLLKKGDLIYGESSLVPEGIARTMSVDEGGAGTAFAWHTRRVEVNQSKVNPHVLALQINYSEKSRSHLIRVSTQTALTGMTTVGYFSTPIAYPSLEEQNKISELFIRLDNLITLHQRKLDKIKSMKKAYLYEMFPAEGESRPKRRFKGFTDDWEKRKLGDIADQTYGGGTPRTSVDEFWNGDIPWIQSSDLTDGKLFRVVPKKMISAAGLKNSATKLVPKNSIAIITRVGVGKLAFMPFAYATSQDFLSLSKLNIDPWFGVYSCYKKLQSELHSVQGTSIKGITKDELLIKNISVPCTDEQEQIGEFFKNLDNLITLHQHKLDKLKNLKKSYLNEMFI